MRIVPLVIVFAVAACSESVQRADVPDSEFHARQGEELACFGSVAEAAHPLIARLREDLQGERGISEVRVTRRAEEIFVIDVQAWDSGHDDRGYYHERHIIERLDNGWCQTRILQRLVRTVSY